MFGNLKCPKCKSTNIQFLKEHRKSFSTNKMALGGCLLGPIGWLFGVFGGRSGKDQYHCMDCGKKFKK